MRNRVLTVLVLLVSLLIVSSIIPASAGFIGGDEPLGGFSYIMDCAYKNKPLNEQYERLFYRLYMMYHYDYIVTDKEKEILFRIVEAEATGGTVSQKMNVASCVLARVESPDWGDTIEKVVFDHSNGVWQFSPLGDGRYYSVSITDSTKVAVDNVLKYGKTHDCQWFCSDGSYNKKNDKGEYVSYHRKYHEWSFFDEMHHYFH